MQPLHLASVLLDVLSQVLDLVMQPLKLTLVVLLLFAKNLKDVHLLVHLLLPFL
jgi:hypothetical protein